MCYVHVHECTCSLGMVSRYQKRIPSAVLRTGSGPLLDRIDIHVEALSRASATGAARRVRKPSDDRPGEPNAAIRGRVEAARERQRARFAGLETHSGPALQCNADTLVLARRCKCGAGRGAPVPRGGGDPIPAEKAVLIEERFLLHIIGIETIAIGNSIREIVRLRKAYGTGRWRKLKGIATFPLRG